jgi:sporulation protein YunB
MPVRRHFRPPAFHAAPARRYRKPSPELGALAVRLLCLVTLVATAIFLLDAKLSPTIHTLAELECRGLATSAVNGALLETLEKEQLRYEDLAVLRTNEDGQITSISADVVKLNQLKAAVGAAIDARMDGLRRRNLALPLGKILGIDLLSGTGPIIQARLSLHGESFSTFVSEFDSVGVNQTRHRILLRVETKVYIFLKNNEDVMTFETQVCAAETVIVGSVPNIRWDYNAVSQP